MKREAGQKNSLFLRKGLLFCWASLLVFGCSSYITALVAQTLSPCDGHHSKWDQVGDTAMSQ